MKRVIVIMILVFAYTLCNAQITRKFWGLELGKSTEKQVVDVLKQKGFSPEVDKGLNCISVETDNFFNFGGGMWSYVSFSFYEGKLYCVHFQNNEYQVPMGILEMFNNLKERIETKYAKYNIHDETPQGPAYFDEKTWLWLQIGLNGNVKMITMSYYDDKLWDLVHQKDDDEL